MDVRGITLVVLLGCVSLVLTEPEVRMSNSVVRAPGAGGAGETGHLGPHAGAEG